MMAELARFAAITQPSIKIKTVFMCVFSIRDITNITCGKSEYKVDGIDK